MKTTLIQLGLWCASLGLGVARAQEANLVPPGVPEPGLVLWGSVADASNPNQSITITSVRWSVSDGTKTAVYSAETRPATQIVRRDGQTYYVLQVPFDTRRLGAVNLSDPSSAGVNSFELQAATPPTYTLTPTINGVLATVRSVDGAPASGSQVPLSGFSAAVRGRVVRVDLAITPQTDTYETWAAGFFGSATHPDALRTADPDRDGLNNEREYLAGTDPKSAASVLEILEVTVQGSQVTIAWPSATNKRYRVETAAQVTGPWLETSTVVTGSGANVQTTLSRALSDPRMFYRVRLLP